MSSNPKIVVFKLREVVYTLLLLFLAALLILCLVLMFSGKSEEQESGVQTESTQVQESDTDQNASETASYTPGVYTTPITLGDSTVDIEVTVDKNHINGIRMVNLSEATAAAYPLLSPSLEHIASQILAAQNLDHITCPQENRYTSQLLLSAVSEALKRAQEN